MRDLGNLTDTAQLVITIRGANDNPVARDDAGTAVEAGGVANGTPGSNPGGNVITDDGSDTDVDHLPSQLQVTAVRTGASVSGPVPLPTSKNVYCVIRSPFKDKDSREHFEIRTHKRLIDIKDPTPKTIDELQRIENLPAGVDVEIRL